MRNIAIIGAGMTGLALAYELGRQGRQVTVFEKENTIGGLAGSLEVDGISIDKYYRHIFPSHDELLASIADLGLKGRLIFRKAPMAYFSQGKIYPLNSALDLLRFKPLNFLDRVRVGLSASALLTEKDWQTFDRLSARDYLEKKCRSRGFQVFWEPLLKNKFGDFSGYVSAAWLHDRVLSRSRSGLSGASGKLGYLEGGFSWLFARLAEEIGKQGGRIITGCPVSTIEPTGSGTGPFVLNGDRDHLYNSCMVTLPIPSFIELCPWLPGDYRNRLAAIDYAHSLCLILRLKEPLSPFYWLNIGDASFPFAVVVEHTNWMDKKDYGGQHIVYLSRYVTSFKDDLWTAPDKVLFDTFCRFLKKIFPHFRESSVLGSHVCRDRYTQPIFKTHYSRSIPPFATPVKNFFLVNTSQFYPHSRCMNTSFIAAQKFTAWLPDMEKGS